MKLLARLTIVVAALWVGLVDAAVAADDAPDSGFHAGISLKTRARLEDIGLPGYPGATVHHDKDSDSAAFSFGLWGGIFGLKVTAMEFDSSDSAAAVATYYTSALKAYGPVIDCSSPDAPRKHAHDDDVLTCDKDDVKPYHQVLKSGVPKAERIVEIKPEGDAVEFTLVRVVVRGTD